ncbi:MAG: UDP-N-acetylmuramoyl-tripeptide--D-alanyl-D-alanine ligase [Muribaculaceae bacterium]|nr:UDP-N-acetylmuramoyl-tripeptide--D-alanyl-D-alanine ligase [Muribaculaceae bacterium]
MQSYELFMGMSTALLVIALLSLHCNVRRDLMMLQQNSYMNDRYVRWFNQSGESTNYLRIGACIALLLCLVRHIPFWASIGCAILIMGWIAVSLVKRKYKKPLVVTKRVNRLYAAIALLSAAITAITWVATGGDVLYAAVAVVALNVISPLVMLLANVLLRPVEKHINRKFYNEAKSILQSMPDLKIIGVTGSYGKTSTKHYLNRILSEKYDVAMTPGNFNTTLGVIRTVREYLKPYNEVFIVEMGAKQLGDIKEICDLVNPTMGIVTAVGEQHLESFKTIENVQRTKFELVDALPSDGLAIVNNDFAMAANRKVDNVKCLRYGVSNIAGADYSALIDEVTPEGTTFTVKGEGKEYRFHTRLVGECNISNLTAAVIAALTLGVDEKKIAYAIEKIEQVEHRLNMKRTAGGVTIIDDAYNSNPTGSKMALDVLSAMTQGKRIVVTPGMVELGERQYELNKELGKYAASRADVIIVVGQYNKDALSEGLAEGEASDDKVMFASTFNEAQQMLSQILKKGDTVLYENDLPDTFK